MNSRHPVSEVSPRRPIGPAISFCFLALVLSWSVVAVAREQFVPGQLIIKYKEPAAGHVATPAKGRGAAVCHSAASLAALDHRFGLIGAQHPRERRVKAKTPGVPAMAGHIPAIAWRVLSFPSSADVKGIAAAYASDPNVAVAEPNYIGSLGYVPADPAYAGRQRSTYNMLHLEDAWGIQKGDPSVVVAVIDSGVDVNHPDLSGAIASGGWDYVDGDGDISDDLGHGTRVAGIIAAAENGQGGVGVAFGCRILPFDVSDLTGQVNIANVIAAIEDAADQGAHVINLSLSFTHSSQILQEAVDAVAGTAVVVAAAGNDGQGDSPRYPASCNGVLGVAAIDASGGCAIFTNFNGQDDSLVDLTAPGVQVYSTTPGGGWSGGPEASGTSFAAPFVSAAAALLRAKYPDQSPVAIAAHLKKTAGRQPAFREQGAFWRYSHKRNQWGMGAYSGHDNAQGSGLVNPYAALNTPMVPTLSVRSVSVVDDPLYSAVNDGDGELDKGETVRLRVELACADTDALDLVTRLICADPRITLLDGTTTVTQLGVSLSVLRCDRTAVLTYGNVYVDPAAGRGEVPFVLGCTVRSGTLSDLAFSVRVENKVPISGPQPDMHFTSDNAYYVENDLTLSGVCLVDPGTPFTVHPGKKIRLVSGASLTAVGTEANPITITSLYKIPDLSLVTQTPDRPVAGLSDPHNVGPKTVAVNLGDYQQVRYVSANMGNDTTGNGTLSSPWQSIQYSLDQITDASGLNRYALLVAEGTYTSNGSAAVTMKEWVDLWGGFEPAGWSRDAEAHTSIVDGETTRPGVLAATNACLDGFTVTRGHGDAGGGILCSGSAVISNNVISANSGETYGGGIRCSGTVGSPVIANNLIFGNRADMGGGIYCGDTPGFGLSPSISNNVIFGNLATSTSGQGGGGICQTHHASTTIYNNVISGNVTSARGGGLGQFYYAGGFSGTSGVHSNVVCGNRANWGGGIAQYLRDDNSIISNNVIVGNFGSVDAGGVRVFGFQRMSNNAIVSNNAADQSSSAIWSNASMWPSTMLNSIVRDNVGAGNQISDASNRLTLSHSSISGGWSGAGSDNVDADPHFVGVIASGTVSALSFDIATSRSVLTVSRNGLINRDLTGWVVQVGNDLDTPTSCAYAAIASYTTDTLVLWGDARKAVDGSTIAAPTNWQIFDYHLLPDSPMKGLGIGPDDPTSGALISRFDGDGQPRFGTRCEIGPDEIEYDTDFPNSVWGLFEIENGATADLQHVRFENGSGVKLDGAAGGGIDHCTFFQHYGAGLDASGGTLSSVQDTSATACWGPGIVAPNAALNGVVAERNHRTGLTAASAIASRSDANRGHGFDLSGAGEDLVADNNTTDGIRAASMQNSAARGNGAWGAVGSATQSDVQNNGAGGILGSATGCRAIGNAGPGIQNGAQAIRCEVRDNAATGILNMALVEDCTISGNGGAGIASATQVTNTHVSDNAGPGAVGGTFFDTTLEANLGAGAMAPARLSHCTVSRNAADGVTAVDATGTVNNTLVSDNKGSGLVNLLSANSSNILGNAGFAAADTIATGGGSRDFTGNYWGAHGTDELTSQPEGTNLTFLNDALDGSGTWNLDVWPYATQTVPEAPRTGGPPWAWQITPDLTVVTSIGPTTFTITYTASMDTSINPSVTFGLEDPYQLRIVEPAPGWINPTTWQGAYTIGTQTGDGINTIRISGAMAADGFPIPDDTSHRFYINTRDPHVANNGLVGIINRNSLRCSWDPPAGGSTPSDRYNLVMSVGNLDNFARVNPSLIADTSYTVDSLTPETVYFFKTQWVEADGTTTDWTGIYFGITPADDPAEQTSMTLNARILDTAAAQPIAGAQVTLAAETTDQDVSDTNGEASVTVSAVPGTVYTATVTHSAYQTATRQYTTTSTVSDVILLAPNPPAPFTMTLHGFVFDAETSLPVAAVAVIAEGHNTVQTLTGGDGSYSLDVLALADGFVSMSAQSTTGTLSASAFLPAAEGSRRVDFAMIPELSLDPVGNVAAEELQSILIPLVVHGAAGATITLTANGLPGGALLDQANSRIDWQPQTGDAGNYDVVVYADASDGRRAYVAFQITVAGPPPSGIRDWMLFDGNEKRY